MKDKARELAMILWDAIELITLGIFVAIVAIIKVRG